MSRSLDMDNPTEEQRLCVELLEARTKELDGYRKTLADRDLDFACAQFEHDVARKESELLADLAERAWGIIANVGYGDWDREHEEWRDAARRWRDEWHAALDRRKAASK